MLLLWWMERSSESEVSSFSSSPSLDRIFSICFVSMKKFDTSNRTTKFCFVSWTTQDSWQVFRENNGKVFRLKKERRRSWGGEYIIPTRGAVPLAGYYYCWEFEFLLPLDSWNFGILNGSCISNWIHEASSSSSSSASALSLKENIALHPFLRNFSCSIFPWVSCSLCGSLSHTCSRKLLDSHWKDVLVSFLLLELPFFFEAMPFLHFLFLIKWE